MVSIFFVDSTSAQESDTALQSFTSESMLIEELEALQIDRAGINEERGPLYQRYIELSERNNWPTALLHSQVLKLEMDYIFENSTFTDERLSALKTRAEQIKREDLIIRLELLNLQALSKFSNLNELFETQSLLENKAKQIEDNHLAGFVYAELAESYYQLGDYTSAVRLANSAFEYYEKANDRFGQGAMLNMLANVHADTKDYEKSIEYHKLAGQIAKELGNLHSYSISLQNLGRAYISNEQYEIATKTFEDAIQLSVQIEAPFGVAYSQQQMGKVALNQGEYEKAIALIESSRKFFKENNHTIAHLYDNLGLIKANLAIGNLSKALELIEEFQSINDTLERKFREPEFNDLLAEYEFATGNYADAYIISRENSKLKQRLRDEADQNKLLNYKRQFESRLSQKENEALRYQNELNTLELENQAQQTKLWYIGGGITLVILAIVLYLLVVKIKLSKRFEMLASVDMLTSSPNRRSIVEHGRMIHAKAKQDKSQFTLALVDLDKFKSLNDNFGHATGDNVLKAFAQACKNNLRENDKFGRFGGEEWLFVLATSDTKIIVAIFERLRDALNEQSIEGLPEDHQVTFSMGASIYDPSTEQSLEDLINNADEKLYVAKDKGRNQVVF